MLFFTTIKKIQLSPCTSCFDMEWLNQKSFLFCDVTLWDLVNINHHIKGTFCLHHWFILFSSKSQWVLTCWLARSPLTCIDPAHGLFCLLLACLLFNPHNWGCMIFQKISWFSWNYTAWYSRRENSLQSLLRESQIHKLWSYNILYN